MRDEMMTAVIRRALEHPEFRDRLVREPERALADHGFALEDDELSEIRALQAGRQEDIEQRLSSIAERFGVDPDKTGESE